MDRAVLLVSDAQLLRFPVGSPLLPTRDRLRGCPLSDPVQTAIRVYCEALHRFRTLGLQTSRALLPGARAPHDGAARLAAGVRDPWLGAPDVCLTILLRGTASGTELSTVSTNVHTGCSEHPGSDSWRVGTSRSDEGRRSRPERTQSRLIWSPR